MVNFFCDGRYYEGEFKNNKILNKENSIDNKSISSSSISSDRSRNKMLLNDDYNKEIKIERENGEI